MALYAVTCHCIIRPLKPRRRVAAPQTCPTHVFDALPAGAAIFGDYRTLHRGTANRSPEPRPLLMHVYGREWWSDAVNYGVSLSITLDTLCMVWHCVYRRSWLSSRESPQPQLYVLSSFTLKARMLLLGRAQPELS